MTGRLILLFLAAPLVEVYFLIQIGGAIGAFPTILLVVFTAVLGALLVRAQGLATFMRARQQLARDESPALAMLEGVALFVAGALLLTPGFFTDAVGFALLTPPLRKYLIREMLRRAARHHGRHAYYASHASHVHGRVIDVEAETEHEKVP